MGENKFSDRLTCFIESDSTVESEHGGYMEYGQQMNLATAGYLVPLAQFQERLDRYAQEIQKAVKSCEAQ